MDDTQENGLAAEELLAGSEQSAAETEENTSEDEANTGTDEGTAEDSEAEPSDDDENDEDEQPKKRKRSGVDRLKRRIETLEAELQNVRSRPTVDSGNIEAAVKAEIGEPPKESDYPDYLAYERAMIAYEADKRQVTREVKRAFEGQAAQQAARQAEAFDDYKDRLAEADKAIPGLAATITKADVQIRNDIGQLIIESDKGPLLAHHLAKNPQKAAELNRMSPIAAAKELGRLEARLSLPKPNTATKAPPPTAPIKGGASASVDPDRMSLAQYRKWRSGGGGR